MEEYVVYILWSEKFFKRYTGFTSGLINRFASHNNLSKKGWTIKYRPWKVVFVRFFNNKKDAMIFEKFLKSGKGRSWTNDHVNINV